ncbi:MAG: pitrilysin family protein [Candidatus Aminicenantes bacterium]|nr:pitrilysin family protein [Candidatus Aminicenantes bacterium]
MISRRLTRLILLIPLFLLIGLAPIAAQELSLAKQVIERTLPNGLKVLMVKRADTPTVRCILAFRVGSVNERPGITGVSHFHEHMMFKGTYTMGIKPGTLEKDNEYNRQIDALEEQIVAEESKIKGRDEAKLMALKKQASDLLTKEKAETIVSEEIWGAYQEAGGTGLNASTGQEMTQYYVTLPKNKLELYFALEADRMVNPIFREFYSERDVIVEERRMSENRPGFFFSEQLNATFYAASPYHWEVLGWMSDVSRITKQEMMDYRNQYYRPDNAVLVLAGDIDVEPTMVLINKYFGAIPPKGPAPRVRTEEPSPEYYRKVNGPDFKAPYVEKRVLGRAAANPSVQIMFHIPPLWHDDLPPLSILSQVMSARTGKMYLDLVLKNEHASNVSTRASNSEYDGEFSVSATAKEIKNAPVVPLDQLEKELWTYIEEAKNTPCDETLLQRVKNSVEARYLQSLAGTGIAGQLASMEVAYRWQHLDDQYKQRMAVTPADLTRVAKKYLTKENCVTGVLEREK